MYPLQTYLQLLEQRLRQLEDRALLAEAELRELKEAFARVKPVHIGSVNYKVQELTVSDLSGALNIGLTAMSDPEQLERWIREGRSDAAERAASEAASPAPDATPDVALEHLQGREAPPRGG